jgi:hypothetical protein
MPHLADRWEDRVVSFQLCPGALVLSAARRRQRAGYNRFTGCKMHDAVTGCKMHHAGSRSKVLVFQVAGMQGAQDYAGHLVG